MKKILVLGGGLLGQRLKFHYPEIELLSSSQLLRHPQSPKDDSFWVNFGLLESFDIIINTIAITDTRFCECADNEGHCEKINVQLPIQLSAYCAHKKKKFVQISTGCVYAESNGISDENSLVDPSYGYAKNKLKAENGLSENDLILRGRLFYSTLSCKSNLLYKIKNFKQLTSELNSFTFVDDLAKAAYVLSDFNQCGIFNVACKDVASLYEIGEMVGLKDVEKISSASLREKTGIVIPNIMLDVSKVNEYILTSDLELTIKYCWRVLS